MGTDTTRKPTPLQVKLFSRGLKGKELAPRMGYNDQYIDDVIGGRNPMTDRFARALSMATQIPLAEIQGDGQGA